MSVETKKRFKNRDKIVGGILFALLLFSNIKVALMDRADIEKNDISVLGIGLNLFEAIYAVEYQTNKELSTKRIGSWPNYSLIYCCKIKENPNPKCPSTYPDCI
jgi:hypothetical protein